VVWSGDAGPGGLGWGSSLAARCRVVRGEGTRGSIVICGTHRASILVRPRWAPVNVTSYRASCGYGLPSWRAAPRRRPAQLLRLAGLSAIFDGRIGCQPASLANSVGLCRHL